ncbi:T9SS type A sorting domain-containing protein [Aquimarina sp. 2304DJ70-9]|uniref:T9SS type A sorting domain-containing protein n=1 Tax=Aquimarina penaris TaxID=3231044 RepID=UPI003461A96E
MNPKISMLLFYLVAALCYGQNFNTNSNKNVKGEYSILRSTVGVGGSSKTMITNTGNYSVSQSIGQSSVIGTYSKNGYTIRQGFQQPFLSAKIISPITTSNLKAVLYPNPFQQSVNISFNTPITNQVNIVLIDIMGRTIRSQEFPASQLIALPLEEISDGTYFLKVSSGNKKFTAKLIKE